MSRFKLVVGNLIESELKIVSSSLHEGLAQKTSGLTCNSDELRAAHDAAKHNFETLVRSGEFDHLRPENIPIDIFRAACCVVARPIFREETRARMTDTKTADELRANDGQTGRAISAAEQYDKFRARHPDMDEQKLLDLITKKAMESNKQVSGRFGVECVTLFFHHRPEPTGILSRMNAGLLFKP
ncbi:hypothetical protein Loa_02571 [Legionella oakridgensis ATCC 33761 = DSM 21215]|uniref:Uncharacterized protein n=1 Tax=Legionella oakridgensis ATCC 33761 = DSM 21215 TaxID=1268635 RepID=W0BC40_9GAMM|nr:hypothetical protein [Legionella oakridgensis]AHE68108.1 hypothetical protein Loa_02571 [Legionella oakridgensis ATCC 33761 = DSM 21215]